MNMMDVWEKRDRLRSLIAGRMIESGEVLSHRCQSNEYVGVDCFEVRKFGHTWSILYIDGMACEIKKLD